MKLTRYLYKGPQSAATLRLVAESGKSAELLEVQLMPGKPVELPADHDYVLVLLALKHLELLPDDVAESAVVDAPAAQAKKGAKA